MYFQFGSRIYGERRGKRKRRRITSEEKYTSLYNIERKEALGIPPAVNINFETVRTRAKRKKIKEQKNIEKTLVGVEKPTKPPCPKFTI